MTALMVIVAALFAGLALARGRRSRRYYTSEPIVYDYDPDLIDNDVDVYCDNDGGDDGCSSEDYQDSGSASDDRRDD